jgi:HEAT repeat protein
LVAIHVEVEDGSLQRASMIAMARAGRAYPELARELDVHALLAGELGNPRRALSEVAVLSLGVLGGVRASATLSSILIDDKAAQKAMRTTRIPIRARALAAYSIGLLCDGRESSVQTLHAVHHLSAVLQDEGTRYADLQTACVLGLGLVRFPQFSGEDDLSLGRSLSEPVESLIALLENKRTRDAIRTHAPTAIARLVAGGPESLRQRAAHVLLEHANRSKEKKDAVRHSSLAALGLIGTAGPDGIDKKIRAGLTQALRGGQSLERNFAALALGQVGGRMGSDPAASMDGASEVAKALSHMLVSGKSRQRPWIGLALGVQGHGMLRSKMQLPREVLSSLAMRVQETRTPQDTSAYCLAAGLARSTQAQKSVEEDLDRVHDDSLRAKIALSLGLMGASTSRELLAREMDESSHKPQMMEQAGLARHLLGDTTLVPDLIEKLGECDCGFSASGVTQALSWTRDPRAVAPLLKMARDKQRSNSERAAAVIALGRLADDDPLPIARKLAHGVNYPAAPATLTDPTGYGVLDVL